MPVTYHTTKSGAQGICTATVRACPLGGAHVSRSELVHQTQEGKSGSEAFNDVLDQLETYDEVHYRVFLGRNDTQPKVVCVQSFDYYSYDGARFLEPKAYKSEAEAEVAAADFNEFDAPESMRTPLSKTEQIRRTQLDKTGQEAFFDVISQLEDYNDVHYRVYLSTRTKEPVAICVQSFDYHDYTGSHFLDKVAYRSEEEAEASLSNFS